MAAFWPDYAKVETQGYTVAQDPDVARTPFDDGLIRQARRFAQALTVHRITALLADTDAYLAFQAWASANAHAWFVWDDPVAGVPRAVRVRGGAGAITYRAFRFTPNTLRWEAALELEGHADARFEVGPVRLAWGADSLTWGERPLTHGTEAIPIG